MTCSSKDNLVVCDKSHFGDEIPRKYYLTSMFACHTLTPPIFQLVQDIKAVSSTPPSSTPTSTVAIGKPKATSLGETIGYNITLLLATYISR